MSKELRTFNFAINCLQGILAPSSSPSNKGFFNKIEVIIESLLIVLLMGLVPLTSTALLFLEMKHIKDSFEQESTLPFPNKYLNVPAY